MPAASASRLFAAAVIAAAHACGVPAAWAASPVPSPRATLSPLEAQAGKVRSLSREKFRPAFAEALMALARLKREAGERRGALHDAREAAAAFDTQVEMHKTLSEALRELKDAQAERSVALQLGLKRDEAFFLVAELAGEIGEIDTAIKHYVLVVQSQPDQPRGHEAYARLQGLGWTRPLAPSAAPRPRP